MIVGDIKRKLQLGQLLVAQNVLSREQVTEALDFQAHSGNSMLLGEVLVQLAMCTEDQIAEALAAGYGVPYAKVSPRLADARVIDVLPREFIEEHTVLPLFKVRNSLALAVAEPANVFLLEEVERITGLKVHVVCATSKNIKATFETHMPTANVFVIDEVFDAGELSLVEERTDDIAELEAAADDGPVIKLVNYLIYNAVREGASDIHIEPDDSVLRIRYRVDGRLYEKTSPPYKMLPAIAGRIKIMASLDIAECRAPQDGGIHGVMDGRPIDLRVSIIAGQFGEKIVIRIIDNKNVLANLEKLGFSYEMLRQWRQIIKSPSGIILVTGPSGSGKSTTLYSVLKELNDDQMNISTVEDPIEFNLAGINQFQVNEKVGFTFADAMRSLLRQDPDVIMLGEIRDCETARLAVQSALTGHMVLSTLHTNDAPTAVTRLVDIGIEPYLVSAALEAVLAQRLVRKICNNCKEPHDPKAGIRRAVERAAGQVEVFYRGVGCSKCRNSGYKGRIGIYEMLVVDDQLRGEISRSLSLEALRKLADQTGMVTLRQDGMSKVKAGITSVEEVLRVTSG